MNMSLLAYIVRKIGLNKGRPRVYLDTRAINVAGFESGKTYSRKVDVEQKRITLTLEKNGQFLVSRKEKNGQMIPVIDIHSAEVLSSFEGMDAVRVVIEQGVIHIMPLASEINRVNRLERMKQHVENGEVLTAGVSFGGGVLDHAAHAGLKAAGLKASLRMANEIDGDLLEHASKVNDVWNDSTIALAAPMQELVQDAAAMSRLKHVDILAMGIPCSGASRAGSSKRKLAIMEDHPQIGHLIASAIMIINKIQPAVIVVENVPEYEATASAQILRQHLRDSGYDIQEKVLKARDFGCLENRNRWFMIGSTRGLAIDLENLEPLVYPVRTVQEILDPVDPTSPEWRSFDYLKSKEVRDAAKGNGFSMQVVEPSSSTVPTLRKGYHKGGSTDPLLAHPTDPELLRQFSVNEHARIKEVPEKLVEGLNKTDGHILLGQGIAYAPVKELFRRIGQSITKWVVDGSTETPQGVTYELGLATG
jgi:DNA (cytosine-5)-methyltransferase 1